MPIYIGLRRNIAIAGLVGLCGVAVAITMLISFPAEAEMWLPVLSFIGAFGGGVVAAPLFGHAKWLGWFLAFLAGLFATYLGSAITIFIAGILVFILLAPIKAIIAGPVFVFAYLVEYPLGFVVWLFFMALIHVKARHWRRRGRDRSIL
ncbi:hypothetical protein PEL8287_00667 [Roseovarius litorisediminis]|uniref:Uncharacterized protein n=1 Tax=Roseovarius litorisediminis TaxID=1312363 RepID=A0A1Y5RFT7_9RHOB|nr:hypothetical protein [Roseovarius litorisediminis]SLN15607.1 hypothetical protein PEL8287_00667 [Roseovarius litorisediminis]